MHAYYSMSYDFMPFDINSDGLSIVIKLPLGVDQNSFIRKYFNLSSDQWTFYIKDNWKYISISKTFSYRFIFSKILPLDFKKCDVENGKLWLTWICPSDINPTKLMMELGLCNKVEWFFSIKPASVEISILHPFDTINHE